MGSKASPECIFYPGSPSWWPYSHKDREDVEDTGMMMVKVKVMVKMMVKTDGPDGGDIGDGKDCDGADGGDVGDCIQSIAVMRYHDLQKEGVTWVHGSRGHHYHGMVEKHSGQSWRLHSQHKLQAGSRESKLRPT